jgi:hypothetical protein
LCADSGCGLKKSLHATERDTKANQNRRAEFLERIQTIPPERLIYLDESGLTTQMTRLYARGLGGARMQPGKSGKLTP